MRRELSASANLRLAWQGLGSSATAGAASINAATAVNEVSR